MGNEDEKLVPFFMPALGSLLVRAEDLKGAPLTYDEVVRIRDRAPCIMLRADHAREMHEQRGYRDIDPDNCWHEWRQWRRELGRQPDLDPGPRFTQIQRSDPAYQQTIRDARTSLDRFRALLPQDGSPRANALVKTVVRQEELEALLWLTDASIAGSGFLAELFEIPPERTAFRIGDSLEISEDAVLDWMVNDGGVLHGGFSLRYQRETLPESERAAFDQHVGVTRYA